MLIPIGKLIVTDRIRKDFGDINELADDIRQNGLINPPVASPNPDGTYNLIAGERRLRALKALGYEQIEIRPMSVKDAEHALNLEISENEVRKDFSKAERIDYAKRLERIEGMKAAERMKAGVKDPMENFPQGGTTRDIVAEKLGIGSGRQYEKEKFIVENQSSLTPSDFADWDEGKLSTNKAFQKIKAEQRKLQDALSAATKDKDKLNREISKLRDNPPMPKAFTELREKNLQQNEQIQHLTNQLKSLQLQVDAYNKQAAKYTENSKEYQHLKESVEAMVQKKNEMQVQIDKATELAELTVKAENFLSGMLAPIKFRRCMEVLDDSTVAQENLLRIVEAYDRWSEEMHKLLDASMMDGVVVDM